MKERLEKCKSLMNRDSVRRVILIAGALGIKLAIGDKADVYSFCGDGSFNMMHGEIVTALQEHKKIPHEAANSNTNIFFMLIPP